MNRLLKLTWKGLTLIIPSSLGEGILLLPSLHPNEFQICLYLDHFPLLQHSSDSFNKANCICIWQVRILFFLEYSTEKGPCIFPAICIQHSGSKLQQRAVTALEILLWTKMPLLQDLLLWPEEVSLFHRIFREDLAQEKPPLNSRELLKPLCFLGINNSRKLQGRQFRAMHTSQNPYTLTLKSCLYLSQNRSYTAASRLEINQNMHAELSLKLLAFVTRNTLHIMMAASDSLM